MAINDTAKNRIRDLVFDDIGAGAFGTGVTPPASSDTTLEAELPTTSTTLNKVKGNKTISATHTLLSTVANGDSLGEFGSFMNSNTVLYDRVVFPVIDKTSSFEVSTTVLYRFV
jgi:hypothetical protein